MSNPDKKVAKKQKERSSIYQSKGNSHHFENEGSEFLNENLKTKENKKGQQ